MDSALSGASGASGWRVTDACSSAVAANDGIGANDEGAADAGAGASPIARSTGMAGAGAGALAGAATEAVAVALSDGKTLDDDDVLEVVAALGATVRAARVGDVTAVANVKTPD